MRSSQSVSIVLSILFLAVKAAPQQPWHLLARQAVNDTTPACLLQHDPDPKARAAAVAIRDQGFIYGPSLIGDAAFFPNGTLGNARTQYDMALWGTDRAEIDNRVAADAALIQAAIVAVSNAFLPPW